jgi:probable HAF family extracellular repeat protein
MTPLGIAGEVNSTAKDINELGQVVGAFFYDPQNPQYYANAFLWSAMAGFLDLGNLGGAYCMASAINDQGQVVGSAAFIPQKGQRAFLWTAEAGMQDLNDLVSGSPGIIVDAFDINEAGQIVGVTAGGRACLLTLAPLPVTLWLLGPVLLVLPWWRRPF